MTQPRYQDHLDRLERYWRRRPFHDELIHKLTAQKKRVILRIGEMTLVVTGVTEMQRCEIPAMWLDYRLKLLGDQFRLDIETDVGPLVITGSDVRLIRNEDMAILIPPVDSD